MRIVILLSLIFSLLFIIAALLYLIYGNSKNTNSINITPTISSSTSTPTPTETIPPETATKSIAKYKITLDKPEIYNPNVYSDSYPYYPQSLYLPPYLYNYYLNPYQYYWNNCSPYGCNDSSGGININNKPQINITYPPHSQQPQLETQTQQRQPQIQQRSSKQLYKQGSPKFSKNFIGNKSKLK